MQEDEDVTPNYALQCLNIIGLIVPVKIIIVRARLNNWPNKPLTRRRVQFNNRAVCVGNVQACLHVSWSCRVPRIVWVTPHKTALPNHSKAAVVCFTTGLQLTHDIDVEVWRRLSCIVASLPVRPEGRESKGGEIHWPRDGSFRVPAPIGTNSETILAAKLSHIGQMICMIDSQFTI